MQNEEAARYARWAAGVAVVIAVVAVAFYFSRELRQAHARRHGPKAVPATVEQQSAGFSFSKVEQDRTIYTVQASKATQFTGENASLLEDVTITFFGNLGDRNDVFRTHECDYDRISGGIRCQGAVEIDIQAAANPGAPSGAGATATAAAKGGALGKGIAEPRTLVVNTSDVVFNRETGVATTTQKVTFRLPNADGQAVGVNYDSKGGKLRLERDVQMQVRDLKNDAAVPVNFTGAQFEYDRDVHIAKLAGGAKVVQGDRQLTAQTIVVELDQRMHAKNGVAEGNPVLQMHDGEDTITGRADRFEAKLDEAGWVQDLRATNNVDFEKTSGGSTEKLFAQNAHVLMEPKVNQPHEMQAVGNVRLETNGASGSDRVETSQVNVAFVPGEKPPQRRIGSAEFPAAATAHLSGQDGTMTVLTHHGLAEFDAANHIRSFEGDSGVQIARQPLGADTQRTTAQKMNASFDEQGRWDTVNLDQKVHFTQGDRQADAHHAQIINATNTIVLTGNASVADSSSRTTAEKIEIQQQGGDVSGSGGVHSQVMSNPQDKRGSQGQDPAFVTADRVDGSTAQGHLTYSGHARLWQGDAMLNANSIELWRQEQRLDAHGNVVAVFPQGEANVRADVSADATVNVSTAVNAGHSSGSKKPVSKGVEAKDTAVKSAGPVRWKIQAPEMQYWNIEGRAHLQGGVNAQSQDEAFSQSLQSQTLDVYLSPAPAPGAAPPPHTAKPAPPAGNGFPGLGSREVTRALATGAVVVRQGDKRGTAERAEYTAADEKFVLSGGSPTFTDAADQTTTAGRSLTFYRASDTVSVDSENGSRTLTKHRVEK